MYVDDTIFDIIEYENEIDIRKYILKNPIGFYMIWTKKRIMRMQLSELNFDKHTIMENKDSDYYLLSLTTKAGDILERIMHHMNINHNHNKCLI
ncbi:hypothetical protein BABINDRAFT_42668 [Babjeviella inositovora NRRL Y-12698]|uniref:Uncharacterized protein n=1 Tax=Babjeviella inositovora NRRL Y-12698 TaxID=984486 RepID=A0A1E3QGR0_9ASCO|nr:uncharacterized protein BABINDRAFT_42668 [Babjeviella inositovora NRRL Y-12698]ODQ76886.1 hypothetical protein BABINDRAFT_42668 [Babjeviella inositovora NRRL Y-12698]